MNEIKFCAPEDHAYAQDLCYYCGGSDVYRMITSWSEFLERDIGHTVCQSEICAGHLMHWLNTFDTFAPDMPPSFVATLTFVY